jgi:hypothetical protein
MAADSRLDSLLNKAGVSFPDTIEDIVSRSSPPPSVSLARSEPAAVAAGARAASGAQLIQLPGRELIRC